MADITNRRSAKLYMVSNFIFVLGALNGIHACNTFIYGVLALVTELQLCWLIYNQWTRFSMDVKTAQKNQGKNIDYSPVYSGNKLSITIQCRPKKS